MANIIILVCSQPPRSTQPSTLCGTVKWSSALGLSGDSGCRRWQPTGGLTFLCSRTAAMEQPTDRDPEERHYVRTLWTIT